MRRLVHLPDPEPVLTLRGDKLVDAYGQEFEPAVLLSQRPSRVFYTLNDRTLYEHLPERPRHAVATFPTVEEARRFFVSLTRRAHKHLEPHSREARGQGHQPKGGRPEGLSTDGGSAEQ
jgi:hypothetical protein